MRIHSPIPPLFQGNNLPKKPDPTDTTGVQLDEVKDAISMGIKIHNGSNAPQKRIDTALKAASALYDMQENKDVYRQRLIDNGVDPLLLTEPDMLLSPLLVLQRLMDKSRAQRIALLDKMYKADAPRDAASMPKAKDLPRTIKKFDFKSLALPFSDLASDFHTVQHQDLKNILKEMEEAGLIHRGRTRKDQATYYVGDAAWDLEKAGLLDHIKTTEKDREAFNVLLTGITWADLQAEDTVPEITDAILDALTRRPTFADKLERAFYIVTGMDLRP